MKDKLHGGKGDSRPDSDFNQKWLKRGIKHEMEHTDDASIAKEIAKDHLTEDPMYYKKLRRIEKSMNEDMLKAGEMTGERGGHYTISKHGKRVYKHAQALHNIKTATKHALHGLRNAKIGHYEKARKFLSQYQNHPDQNVRRVVSKAHEVIGRAAHEMVGRSKTDKARHIYGMIHKHHSEKVNPTKPAQAKSEWYAKKADFHKNEMERHNQEYKKQKEIMRSVGSRDSRFHRAHQARDYHENMYRRNQRHYASAHAKSKLGRAIFGVSMTKAKSAKHLEKRRNKRGVMVNKWVKNEKVKPKKKTKAKQSADHLGMTPKQFRETYKRLTKKQEKSLPAEVHKKHAFDHAGSKYVPKLIHHHYFSTGDVPVKAKPKSTSKKKGVKVSKKPKESKKKTDYKKSDMYKLQTALDSVMRNPNANPELSDKLDWKLIEYALKQGSNDDVKKALQHVQSVIK